MQHRAALWITGAFHILPLWGVKAIASLIPIHLHLNKIGGRHHLQMAFLPKYHTFNSLMDDHYSKKAKSHCLSMSKMIDKQQYRIKSSIIDFNNQLNKAFPTFDKLHKELSCFQTSRWFPYLLLFLHSELKNHWSQQHSLMFSQQNIWILYIHQD